MYPSDQQFTFCTLNARSLNNKSSAFVDFVCDVRADLFTVCETWLKDHHSAVLSELTPPGYKTIVHCPRPGRRGGGTALLVKEGINVNIFSTVILASHSFLQFVAFWCRSAFIVASDWFVLPI